MLLSAEHSYINGNWALTKTIPQGGALPHLCPDQGLKAGLEVVKSAAVEPWHLIQELLVLGLEVFPHRPQLFSGLGNKTLVSGLSLKGAGCGNSEGPGSAGPHVRTSGQLFCLPCCSPSPSRAQYLVELGQHWASLLLFLVLLHLGLQPPVVLQGLLPPLHCHVEAWEYAAKPVGHSRVRTGLSCVCVVLTVTPYSETCMTHLLCARPNRL